MYLCQNFFVILGCSLIIAAVLLWIKTRPNDPEDLRVKNNYLKDGVIGGVIGAAGGYGIGRTMDKKDGRIDYSTIIN